MGEHRIVAMSQISYGGVSFTKRQTQEVPSTISYSPADYTIS